MLLGDPRAGAPGGRRRAVEPQSNMFLLEHPETMKIWRNPIFGTERAEHAEEPEELRRDHARRLDTRPGYFTPEYYSTPRNDFSLCGLCELRGETFGISQMERAS